MTTDAQGIAQAKITLPQDRVMAETPDSTYYIEEISAPVGYALAADREITLKPGTVYQGSGRIHIEDATAVVIELTKYCLLYTSRCV